MSKTSNDHHLAAMLLYHHGIDSPIETTQEEMLSKLFLFAFKGIILYLLERTSVREQRSGEAMSFCGFFTYLYCFFISKVICKEKDEEDFTILLWLMM